ncbi:MAG: formimidoylglutamase [Phototrophicales bacterium]
MLFELTTRPNPDVFYHRDDPNDIRLGELISFDPTDYERAKVIILGCPQDEGVQRNQGRVGARYAPDAIRRAFYRLSPLGIHPEIIFDIGDTRVQTTLEETHAIHQQVVQQIIQDNKKLIVLGGGNDISYPDCAGLAQAVIGNVAAFNIDAHFDVRADTPCNSGTPYRQLLEGAYIQPENFYEMGYHPFANSPVYLQYLKQLGVNIHSLENLHSVGVKTKFEHILNELEHIQAIFWGIDMDAIHAAEAPGVSAPNSLGLTGHELCQIMSLAGYDKRTHLIEFTEVNPTYDIDERTSKLVAIAIYHYLATLAIIKL